MKIIIRTISCCVHIKVVTMQGPLSLRMETNGHGLERWKLDGLVMHAS